MVFRSTSVKSKWIKTMWLLKNKNLRGYVPHTKLFTGKNLLRMLDTHSTVFFKPTGGTGGARIIRIKRKARGFESQYNRVKTANASIKVLYRRLKRFSKRDSFLLQQGINLAKTNGRPFDIRVMVQKDNSGKWVCTAMFMKIGRPGKVATNYHQGGDVGLFGQTLARAGYDKNRIKQTRRKLRNLGISVGKHFDRQVRGMRELGLDVALDDKGRIWILEVNTRPQFYPLKYLKDKRMYRTIHKYAKMYGRVK